MNPKTKWTPQLEEELTLIIKDWLKQQGRTQADLKRRLQADSTRMPALLAIFKAEYRQGGITKVADLLCKIEKSWSSNNLKEIDNNNLKFDNDKDPFDQLDLILEEIREDIEN